MRVGDDVVAQKRLLREHLGVEQLALVFGGSMGAQQAYERAVRFPDEVQRAAPLAGTAKAYEHVRSYGQTLVDALRSDPGWADGRYAASSDVADGLRLAIGGGKEPSTMSLPVACWWALRAQDCACVPERRPFRSRTPARDQPAWAHRQDVRAENREVVVLRPGRHPRPGQRPALGSVRERLPRRRRLRDHLDEAEGDQRLLHLAVVAVPVDVGLESLGVGLRKGLTRRDPRREEGLRPPGGRPAGRPEHLPASPGGRRPVHQLRHAPLDAASVLPGLFLGRK